MEFHPCQLLPSYADGNWKEAVIRPTLSDKDSKADLRLPFLLKQEVGGTTPTDTILHGTELMYSKLL